MSTSAGMGGVYLPLPRALRRRSQGFTLIELVFAIVVISLGLAGILEVYTTVAKGSADPIVTKQMLTVAEEMVEELTIKPFATTTVTPSGCARSNFTSIWNYNNYSTTNQICDAFGNAIASLNGYSVSVSVVTDNVTLAGANVTSGNAAKITVTVSYGAKSLSLITWRTNYAS